MKRKIKRLKKAHAQSNLISELQGELALAVHSSKDYYFNSSLPNFIKSDPSKFWNYIAEKKKPISQMTVNGQKVTENIELANHFNTFFHSVFFLILVIAHTTVQCRNFLM